jgi:hypothetical protein
MPGKTRVVHDKNAQSAANFVDNLINQGFDHDSGQGRPVFDSASSESVIESVIDNLDPNDKIGRKVKVLFDQAEEFKGGVEKISQAIFDGVKSYEAQHGMAPPADLINYALHLGYGTTTEALQGAHLPTFDSATSAHADNLSLQPNRARIAILSAFSEACPWAHYMPADIGSNQAKVAVLSHQASNYFGLYNQNGSMDGIYSGDAYFSATRRHKVTVAAGVIPTGQLTTNQATVDTCVAVGGNVAAVKLMRGRTQIYVNGQVVAQETSANQGGSGASAFNAISTFYLPGSATAYQWSAGSINTDTGAWTGLATTPALPNGTDVVIEGFIDYDTQPSLIPGVSTTIDTYDYFAKPFKGFTQYNFASSAQASNELGLDIFGEALVSINVQANNERHYDAIYKALQIATYQTSPAVSFNFDWSNANLQKTRAELAQDLLGPLSVLSQQMAIKTLGTGITHLYVDQYMLAVFRSLPNTLFSPSGIRDRAGIFRAGRLFGMYEVYYCPKYITGTASAGKILCIGMADDVARNLVIFGDAIPLTFLSLGIDKSMTQGSAFETRNFTEVNKHVPSTFGAALLTYTNTGIA